MQCDLQAIPLGKQWSGKEKLRGADKFIFYTPSSGVWQSVWLEPVPEVSVERLVITPDLDNSRLKLKIVTESKEEEADVEVLDGDEVIIKKTLTTNGDHHVDLGDNLKEWSPDSPFLYDLQITLRSGDHVRSYFGMRKIEMRKVGKFQRIFLNNKELKFQLGPLDQGYWPDGLLTPPTEEAMKWDIEMSKLMGYNMIRKHIKLESRHEYLHCSSSLIQQAGNYFHGVDNSQSPPDFGLLCDRRRKIWTKRSMSAFIPFRGNKKKSSPGFYVSLHRKYKCIIDGWETKLVFCANWYYEYESEYEYEHGSFQSLW